MGIPCGFPVTDTGQRRLHVEGKWKPFIPYCMNMLLTTHNAIVSKQTPETDFVMSGTLAAEWQWLTLRQHPTNQCQ